MEQTPDLIALRKDLARFMHDLTLENYLYTSGQKETLEITPIYELLQPDHLYI